MSASTLFFFFFHERRQAQTTAETLPRQGSPTLQLRPDTAAVDQSGARNVHRASFRSTAVFGSVSAVFLQ